MKKIEVKLGTHFRYTYADSNPEWEVVEARGRGTWICEILPNEPDYGGQQKCFSTEEIQRAIGFSNYWKEKLDESEQFYASLKPDQIVHYHYGFNQYVRCKVTQDKKLLPIALVGEWKNYDLPKRNPDGSITLGYHADQIKNKKPMTPHSSNIWEHSKHLQKNFKNPSTLTPVSLEIPQITDAEKIKAAKIRKLQSIESIVNANWDTPDEAFALIKKILA